MHTLPTSRYDESEADRNIERFDSSLGTLQRHGATTTATFATDASPWIER